MRKRRFLIFAITSSFFGSGWAIAEQGFEAFLNKHCIACHGPRKAKRDLRIDQLSRDFKLGADGHLWAEILERINSGEMPPEEQPRPTVTEIAAVIDELDEKIREGRASRMAARPSVAHYRLSRREYQNTIYDLLGVRYDPAQPGALNADPLWQGYERIGSQLTFSPSHMERYYRAAEKVVSRAFPPKEVKPQVVRKTAADLRYSGGAKARELLDRFGIKRPLRMLLFPGRLQQAFRPNWFGPVGSEKSGLYRARIQVSGIRPPGGEIAHLRIGERIAEAANEGLVEMDLHGTEDGPEVVEFEVLLEMPVNLEFHVVANHGIDRRKGAHYRNALSGSNYLFTHSSETALLNPVAPKMFDENGNGIYPMVLLDWIEWEGPIVTKEEHKKRAEVIPPESANGEEVAGFLQVFASRAWRRPVVKEELKPFLQLYHSERLAGETVSSAYQAALLGVLTSRNFTYLVEGDARPRELLNDHELASRLSYFLWSSMPDDVLMQKAGKGELTGPGLESEVDRLLSDDKISRFIEDFPRQWLQLYRLGMFPPDQKLYPDYDVWLEASLRDEVVRYFEEIFRSNRPIDQFIDSDWTMVNSRLARFYGLPEPKKAGFQKVVLKPTDHRGGILTMGATLGLTSDGTRHRPVHRGVWVSEAILGKTPPPPPANVDAIEPNPPNGPKLTIRDRIKAHASDSNCAACHRKIDPLGLAFDQYDAIGQWRTHERVETGAGEDPEVDASGKMPDGRPFEDALGFKKLLLDDREKFLKAFVEHLCTYALRRVLTIDDREDVRSIVEVAIEKEYQLKDIVRAVALSDLLRKR